MILLYMVEYNFCVEATKGHGGTLRSPVLLAVKGHCVCSSLICKKTESVMVCEFISF